MKICGFAPSGKLDGVIDLYAENAPELLREYFRKTEINNFLGMPGDDIATAEIADEIESAALVFCDN